MANEKLFFLACNIYSILAEYSLYTCTGERCGPWASGYIFSSESKSVFADFLLKGIRFKVHEQHHHSFSNESNEAKTKDTKQNLDPDKKENYLKTVYINYIEGADTFYLE